MNTKIIKLDINRRLYDKIVAKQDDTGSRFLLFQLLDGAVPFNLTDRSVRVYGVKPDGAVIFNDLTVTHSATGFCLLELTNQMLAIAGTVKLELMITEGDKKLTSIPFEMEVIKKINSNDAVESSNEFRALLNALKEIDDWNKEFADKSGKLEELYTPRLNELGSQLETKTSKEYVDKNLNNKLDKTYKMEPENCSEKLLSLVTGTGQINLLSIPQDDSVTTEKILDGTLTEKFNIENKIILNKSNIEIGGGSLIDIVDGVKITQSTGSWFKIVFDLSSLEDGDYTFSFNHKATGTAGDWGGFFKLWTPSIVETSKALSSYGGVTEFKHTFTKTSSMTRMEYMVLTSGTNDFEMDITDIILSKSEKLDSVIFEQNKTIKTIYNFLDDIKIKENILEVSHDFNQSTYGYGVTKFSSPIDAHNYTNDKSNYYNRYIVKVHPGTYKEWETVWGGFDDNVNYRGIRVNDYVYFESTDITKPENYILEWDGYVGCDRTMTTSECMQKALFHIDKRPTHTHIKGFHLKSKNTRYCVHPETAGTGAGNEWFIENCIIEFEGRPNCESEGGTGIGIGISIGETGVIKNCKFIDNGKSGIGGHNNGWSIQWQGDLPFMADGSKLTIENCDLGNNAIFMQTIDNTCNIYDELNIINCKNVSSIRTYAIGEGIVNNWRVKKEFCDTEITNS